MKNRDVFIAGLYDSRAAANWRRRLCWGAITKVTLQRFDNLVQTASENEMIRSIRRGLLHMMPLVLIGSFVLMLLNLPVPAFQQLMETVFGEQWRGIALSIHTGTLQIISLTALVAVSYALACEREAVRSGEVGPINAVLTAFASYVVFHWRQGVIISDDISSSPGLFSAIFVAVLSTYLFSWLYCHRRIRAQTYAYDADSLLMSSLRSFLPTLLTILFFALLRAGIAYSGMTEAVLWFYEDLLRRSQESGGSLLAAILFVLLSHLLWFFGIHGTNILDGAANDLFLTATEANIAAAGAGVQPANIVTKEFFDTFVYLGGCGCTLGLILALLIAGRKSNSYRLGRYSLLPGLFNINEMMVYGLPVIFNIYYILPFLLSPVLLSITTYLAMYLGLVPLTAARVEWTTPIFISGYASTGSIAAVVLQAVNLLLCVLIYLPFIRLYERNAASRQGEVYQKLAAEVHSPGPVIRSSVLHRPDELGLLARSLASELEAQIAGGDGGLHLEYQPKVDGAGRVLGAEALLRWTHTELAHISPLVILGLAEEAGLDLLLGRWILGQAFAERGRWQALGLTGLRLSVNLSPQQLGGDEGLADYVIDGIRLAGIPASAIELELTEHAAISQSDTTRGCLERLNRAGIGIAIDDFAMGHSSLLYLRDLYANVVKIDISLVHTITTNRHSQGIVRSVVQLCRQLDLGLVAEGVETTEQLEMLQELGCSQYQGFYFSRALPAEEFLAYVKRAGIPAEHPSTSE